MTPRYDGRVVQPPPPDGIIPNLENPQDVGRMAYLVGLSLCCVFATIFVFTRVYVRLFIDRRIVLSDVTCVMGWVSTMAYAGTNFAMIHYGLGHHAYDIPAHDYYEFLKWLYASSVAYTPAAFFVKATILLLIARVFAVEEHIAKGLHLFILFLSVVNAPIQTIKIMVCTPIRAFWDPTVPMFGCVNQRILFITDVSIAVFADLVIIIVPIPVTWRMHLPLRKKLKIMLMLSAGSLATCVTIFRLIKVILFLTGANLTVDFVVLGLTTCLEVTIGIVCGCLPSAHVLYQRYRSRRDRDSSKHSSDPSW